MSLAINLDSVAAVLLVDGWHQVEGATFSLDAFELVHASLPSGEPGGRWFEFVEKGEGRRGAPLLSVAGPVESILAVKYRRDSQEEGMGTEGSWVG